MAISPQKVTASNRLKLKTNPSAGDEFYSKLT